jgi:hypothetical protein
VEREIWTDLLDVFTAPCRFAVPETLIVPDGEGRPRAPCILSLRGTDQLQHQRSSHPSRRCPRSPRDRECRQRPNCIAPRSRSTLQPPFGNTTSKHRRTDSNRVAWHVPCGRQRTQRLPLEACAHNGPVNRVLGGYDTARIRLRMMTYCRRKHRHPKLYVVCFGCRGLVVLRVF